MSHVGLIQMTSVPQPEVNLSFIESQVSSLASQGLSGLSRLKMPLCSEQSRTITLTQST